MVRFVRHVLIVNNKIMSDGARLSKSRLVPNAQNLIGPNDHVPIIPKMLCANICGKFAEYFKISWHRDLNSSKS